MASNTQQTRNIRAKKQASQGTKRKAIVAAAEAYAKMEGIDLDKVYIWFDLACVEQDDLAELVRGVNALGLYITACDAFVSIDHADYFDRGWCLMECMFADCSKVPRFKFTTRRHLTEARNELLELRPDMRLENKKPEEGNFTVEDRRKCGNWLRNFLPKNPSRTEVTQNTKLSRQS